MGIKITDIIGEFPTRDEYQIVDVTQISQKGINKSLKVIFQRLYSSDEVHIKYVDVAYSRLIVLGTIWRNKSKVKFPTFLEKYQAFNLDFSKLKISNETLEFEGFGKSYIKEIQKRKKHASYNLITYNVELSVAKKEDGITKLFKPNPQWKNQKTIDFISFFPHEILRYFFTSNEISDLNGSLLNRNNLKWKWKSDNGIINTEDSIKKNGDLRVSLENNKYQNDANLIGDCVYLESFKSIIFNIQNLLNTGGYYYMSNIDKLPVDSCKRFTFSGMITKRKSDGATGLIIFLINELTSYRPHEYTVILTKNDNSDSNSNDNVTFEPDSSGGGKNSDGSTPTVRRNPSRNNNVHEIDETGLEFLLQPKEPVKIEYKIGPKQKNRFILQTEEDDYIGNPNKHGDSGGRNAKLPEYFEQTIYFEFYGEIIQGIESTIRKSNLACTTHHLDENKQWTNEVSPIDRSIINEPITTVELENQQIYITQFLVSKDLKTKWFYLFEMNNGSRTLLYSNDCNSELSKEGVYECLKYFPKKNSTEKGERLIGKIVHYFNHKQTEKINKIYGEKGELKSYDPIRITADKAIESHINKISKEIINSFK